MKRTLFISYSHKDNEPHKWCERLSSYLDAVREQLPLEAWHDGKTRVGGDWNAEIKAAVSNAAAAVLLVGPEFLRSDYILNHELPELLAANDKPDRFRLYPLVVAHVPWKFSRLAALQAHNDPAHPLESLDEPEQNECLSGLVEKITQDIRDLMPELPDPSVADLREDVAAIAEQLEITRRVYLGQAERRNELRRAMVKRLKPAEQLQHERFFSRYYDDMDVDERFQFTNIRGLTETLRDANEEILRIINRNPDVRIPLPILGSLKQHLIVWLKKYETVFTKTERMAVLYTGVEDGVPFPWGVDQQIAEWLEKN